MSDFIAVNDIFSVIDSGSLKRQALMFDRIARPNFRKTLEGLQAQHPDKAKLFAEFDWLLEMGIVFDPDIDVTEETLNKDEEYREFFEVYWNHLSSMDNSFHGIQLSDVTHTKTDTNEAELTEQGRRLWESLSILFGLQAREISLQLRILKGLDAYPVLSSLIPPMENNEDAKATVVQIVLNEFPVPDEQTPWEQIKEFHDDVASRSKFLALKNWINEVARMNLPRIEVEDKLKACISDYEDQMRVHKLKRKLDTLKIIACAEAGFLTTAKLTGWSSLMTAAGMIATPFFTIRQQQVKLMEAEQNTPGREIAYIVKSRQTF
jgi:hypothetical protein